MRPGAGGLASGESLRRQTTIGILGVTTFGILFAMLFLRVSMTAVAAGALLAAAGAATVLYPEVGLCALLLNALVGLSHVVELPRLGPLSVPIAFEGVLALALVVQFALRRRRPWLTAPQHLLLLALSFWIVVSLLANGRVSEENLDALRNLYIVRVLIFFLVTNILDTEASLRRLVGVIAVANVGLLAVSLGTRLGFFGEEKIVVSERLLRTSALVQNPNTLAFELTTMLILAVFTYIVAKRRWVRGAMLVLAIADGAAILSTLSRSGFISLVAVLLFMFFKVTRSARVVSVLLLAALAIGLLGGTDLGTRFARIDTIKDVDRYHVALVGVNAAYDNPLFGVGLGNFVRVFDRYDTEDVRRPLPTHNMYLDLAAQMGLPALALYLGILATTGWRLLAMERDLKRRAGRGSFLGVYAVAVQCFLVNLCVFGLSGDVEFEYSVFTMLGFGMLLHRLWRRGGREGAPGGLRPAGGAA